jgi:hypothetical protein
VLGRKEQDLENSQSKLEMVTHICKPSTQEAEAGVSQVWDQPELNSEILPQKNKNKILILSYIAKTKKVF